MSCYTIVFFRSLNIQKNNILQFYNLVQRMLFSKKKTKKNIKLRVRTTQTRNQTGRKQDNKCQSGCDSRKDIGAARKSKRQYVQTKYIDIYSMYFLSSFLRKITRSYSSFFIFPVQHFCFSPHDGQNVTCAFCRCKSCFSHKRYLFYCPLQRDSPSLFPFSFHLCPPDVGQVRLQVSWVKT